MHNGKYLVLHNDTDDERDVFYTLDDNKGKALTFDSPEEAEAEVKRQLEEEDLSEPREVLVVEVVKRGAAATSFLWS